MVDEQLISNIVNVEVPAHVGIAVASQNAASWPNCDVCMSFGMLVIFDYKIFFYNV